MERLMEIQKDSISRGDCKTIIDDLMATGGTMQAAIDMIYELHATPVVRSQWTQFFSSKQILEQGIDLCPTEYATQLIPRELYMMNVPMALFMQDIEIWPIIQRWIVGGNPEAIYTALNA